MAKADYYVPDERPWFKYYPKGVPHHLDYPEIPLYQFLDDSAEKYPDNIALVFYGKEITYKELKELSDRFANALQNLGIQKGDRVAFLLPNCPQFVIGFYGTMKAGAIPVPLNPLYTGEELKYFFKDAEPRIMLTLDTFYEKVKQGSEVTPQIEKIITVSMTDSNIKCEGALKFKDFLNISPTYNKVEIDPKEDLAVILYTGGTTGEPKGVMLSHWNISCNAAQFSSFFKPIIQEGKDVLSGIVPPFHIYAVTITFTWGFLNGLKIVMFAKFRTEEVLEAVKKYKITLLWGNPAIFAGLYRRYSQSPDKFDLSSIRCCGSGTASFPEDLYNNIKKLTSVPIIEGYGLTETSAVTHCNSLDFQKVKSLGIPFPDVDAKIVDLKSGKILGINQAGELLLKGPQVFKDYWKKAEATVKKIDKEGWLHTGDIVERDRDGYFYFRSRLDDMINVRGEKVWPREVEEVLESHSKVQEVAVIGVEDDYYGQAIKACIVLKEGCQFSEEELIDFCKGKLAPHKVPHTVEFLKKLPRSYLGKILHYVLRKKS